MIDLLIPSAFAQEATTGAEGIQGLTQFAPMIVIFVIFYFLMIRPQKKKLEEEAKMIESLGKGEEIYTKSGLLGTIVGLTEKVVTLEVADGVKLKVLKSQIGGNSKSIFEKKEAKK